MALSTVTKNFTDGTIVLSDGTGTPLTCTVQADGGDFSLAGLQGKYLNAVSKYESRGRVTSIRRGARIYPTVSFTCQMRQFTSASSNQITDFLHQTGSYSAAVSTRSETDVFAFDITFTVEGTDHNDAADHTITLTDVVMTDFSFSEGDPNTFSFSGEVIGSISGIATEY